MPFGSMEVADWTKTFRGHIDFSHVGGKAYTARRYILGEIQLYAPRSNLLSRFIASLKIESF